LAAVKICEDLKGLKLKTIHDPLFVIRYSLLA